MTGAELNLSTRCCKFCNCSTEKPAVFCSCRLCVQLRKRIINEVSRKSVRSGLNGAILNLCLVMVIWFFWYIHTSPESILILERNWQISLTMIFGSFIAGATSEGGGAVAFPVFTKVLHIPPYDAKVFSLAIQSVGMTAATLGIIVMHIPVAWRFILWVSLGGLIGITSGTLWLAPLLSPALTKMLFTAIVASLALALLILNQRSAGYNDCLLFLGWRERVLMLFAGMLGGCISGLVGNGIDIIGFSVLVLLFRFPASIATPSSVVLMSFNSLAGFALHLFVTDGFTVEVEQYWLAAVPVVIFGAPLGTYVCSCLSDQIITRVLIGLILVEVTSSIWLVPLTRDIVIISFSLFLSCALAYYWMFRQACYIR